MAASVAASQPDPAWALRGDGAQPAPLSDRIVDYEIDARLDVPSRTVQGTETITYRNHTGQPLDGLPFHLYLQAFQPGSTFIRELHRDSPAFVWNEKYRGSLEVTSLTLPGSADLAKDLAYIQPDDGNPADRTVLWARLPRPVLAGQEVRLRLAFRAQLPEILARTGFERGFFMVAQWFPKIGVWWHGAWNCHQYHRSSEFFSDFGTYRVRLTVPRDLRLAGSGEEEATVFNRDGTKTVAYRAEDVHDFAWAADPAFHAVEDSWTGSEGLVRIRMFVRPEHLGQAPRFLAALKGALGCFDRWYGPYPYGRITVVDVPAGSAAAGMEYPTLFTVGTKSWMLAGLRSPELEVIHEFSHQYWYGMVATNEIEEAWLDEGLASYSTAKAMDALYGGFFVEVAGGRLSAADALRLSYRGRPETDPLSRPAYQVLSHDSYEAVSYGKAASVLLTLEGLLGEETTRRALATYFRRHRFTHPTCEDLLRAFEETSGRDLRWFFDQAVLGTQVFDYAVEDVDWEKLEPSAPVPPGTAPTFRSTVLLRRKGDFVFPVEVEVRFADGEAVRERWDGRDRWARYSYDRKSRVVSAQIDPDRRVWLDRDRLNDSRTVVADGRAARKLAGFGLLLRQLLGAVMAWLA